ASSVDAERAFSGGRLTINHLQHAMGELTFEAKMALGLIPHDFLPSIQLPQYLQVRSENSSMCLYSLLVI
ncbi:hypothetical protein BDV93DRAFT_460522, partial [Ceratobasidium sp. AG-I]